LSMTQDISKFRYDIGIGWGDCDPAKIVYTANIPGYALKAINAWWEHHLDGDGWFQLELDRNIGTPFVHMSLDFKSPITPRHKLNCDVWPARLGETSIDFRVDGLQDGVLCFEGRFTCVFIVASEFKKQAPPKEIRDIILPKIIPEIAR